MSATPRTLPEDLRKCAAAGADLVFVPTEATIYPRGRSATFVEVPGLSQVLEGASRPHHFRGVATVVLALLEIVRPDVAVFGQKDFQQQLLIRRMIEDLHVPVDLIVEPTVREPDGLAMSSRNRYLGDQDRTAATILYRALQRRATRSSGVSGTPTGFDSFLTRRYHWKGRLHSIMPRWPMPIRSNA